MLPAFRDFALVSGSRSGLSPPLEELLGKVAPPFRLLLRREGRIVRGQLREQLLSFHLSSFFNIRSFHYRCPIPFNISMSSSAHVWLGYHCFALSRSSWVTRGDSIACMVVQT